MMARFNFFFFSFFFVFCVIGVGRVVERAREKLGNNTVVVFTSDNGGATWFGGSNEPLRSGKTTPFQVYFGTV